jgi:hypothetical protein
LTADFLSFGVFADKSVVNYEGTAPKFCLTALISAKQNSVTASVIGHFSAPPTKAVRQNLGHAPPYWQRAKISCGN